MRTLRYAPGRWADVFGEPASPTVLLWHGAQTDARAAVGPLAGLLAAHGLMVVAPDWNSHAADGGRADLLRSLDFTRGLAGDSGAVALVGWSLGGVAAAGVTLQADRFGVASLHTFCLAGAFMVPDPLTGRAATDTVPPDRSGTAFTLLHGVADDVVPVSASRDFAAHLQRIGWPVQLVEVAADHGSIAGADYDPVADRYQPGARDETLRVAGEVAARIAATLRYLGG